MIWTFYFIMLHYQKSRCRTCRACCDLLFGSCVCSYTCTMPSMRGCVELWTKSLDELLFTWVLLFLTTGGMFTVIFESQFRPLGWNTPQINSFAFLVSFIFYLVLNMTCLRCSRHTRRDIHNTVLLHMSLWFLVFLALCILTGIGYLFDVVWFRQDFTMDSTIQHISLLFGEGILEFIVLSIIGLVLRSLYRACKSFYFEVKAHDKITAEDIHDETRLLFEICLLINGYV